MKKTILTGILFLGTLVYAYAADVTLYKSLREITPITVTQPAVVEITNLSERGDYVITKEDGTSVPQQINIVRKTQVSIPQKVEACMTTCTEALALADGNENTTFDFTLLSSGIQRGRITIIYAKALETNQVVFKTTRDSYMPSSFTLTVDGKRILNKIEGESAKFPVMMAQSIVIEFEYNQPIRFTEVGVGTVKEDEVTSSVRFVYEPDTKYVLYLDSPLGRESTPQPAINLFARESERGVALGEVYKNSLYKEQDSDADGVNNSIDNCVMQKNPGQEDSNGNKVGDVCDDYDYDGVITYLDNCPNSSNPNQSDIDKDGIGDVCDQEESRLTEKYAWLPWAIFIGVFLAILAMGYEMVTKKKLGAQP